MPDIQTAVSVAEAVRAFDAVRTVSPRRIPLTEAIGLRAVEDVRSRKALPECDIASIDGWATNATVLAEATRRKPVILPPESCRIDRGCALPAGCNAVLAFDEVSTRGKHSFALVAPAQGQSVVRAGSVYKEGDIFIKAGTTLTLNTAINGAECGIGDIVVSRPVVDVICNASGVTSMNDNLTALIGATIRQSSASLGTISFTGGDADELAAQIQSSSGDVIATLGGTGSGPGDTTIEGLRKVCKILFHGVRLKPGGTMAFSMYEGRPVFSMPGNQLDILAVNAVLTGPFARKVFGRPPGPNATRQAKLLNTLAGGKDGSYVLLGRVEGGEIRILENMCKHSGEIDSANALVIVMEGDRHRRAGEQVCYIKL